MMSNFQALNYCGVSLKEIIDDEAIYNEFVNLFRSTIIYMIENGYKKEGSNMDVCGPLWETLYSKSQKIMSYSIQLVYKSAQDVVSDLASELKNPNMTEKKAE